MKLVKDGNEWLFPELAGVTGLDFSTRNKATAKALQHGGMPSDDGKIDSRNVEVEIIIDGADTIDFLRQTDELKKYAYRKDQQLYITDDRYINASGVIKYKESYYDGFYMVKGVVSVTFLALDPFFYSKGVNIRRQVITTDPTKFTIENQGNIDTPVKITITATDLCQAITLKNTTDNGRVLSYQDVKMSAGQVLVIDANEGTVTRGGDNTINNFGGTFINLLPGDNKIEYTGGACIIEVEYKTRWL